MSEDRRGVWPRIGLTLLNLLVPGPALLRAHSPRLALLFPLLFIIATFVPLLSFRVFPSQTFAFYVAGFAVYFLLIVGSMIGAMVITWRRTRKRVSGEWWSSWPAFLGLLVLCYVVGLAVTEFRPFKPFYIPSEAMNPTLGKSNKFVATMNPRQEIARGDIVLVDAPDGATYIKRVAALQGDTIALRGGIVFLNGRAVAQQYRGDVSVVPFGSAAASRARRLTEQFPGEVRGHDILDDGDFAYDDYPDSLVRPGHIFVLGDNRDRSADSRVEPIDGGLEQVPLSAIRGIPLFAHWGEHAGTRLWR